jgi:hypothetical protein
VADAEGVTPAEIDDAVRLLAVRYPLTGEDVLVVIEEHGLARAEAQIEESVRGEF